jgi:signal transduction histidine kinase
VVAGAAELNRVVDRASVAEWVRRYELAWRTAGTATLAELFTEDATYSTAPYASTYTGLPAIAELWDEQREGPDEAFTMASDVVAVDDARDTALVRVEVHYGEPHAAEWRDLWVIEFAADGRCRAFEEWPFAPPTDRDAERRRFAGQLHDDPVQLLTVAMMRLDLLERAVAGDGAHDQLEHARQAVRDALEHLRALITQLAP